MVVPCGEVWAGILEDLRPRLTPQELATWLRPLRLSGGSERSLRLEAPSPFHLQYVQDRFGALLRDCARSRLGPGTRVDLVVGNGHHPRVAPEVPPRPAPPSAAEPLDA
jgi:chromosomal replication initiation ATPase DnaA